MRTTPLTSTEMISSSALGTIFCSLESPITVTCIFRFLSVRFDQSVEIHQDSQRVEQDSLCLRGTEGVYCYRCAVHFVVEQDSGDAPDEDEAALVPTVDSPERPYSGMICMASKLFNPALRAMIPPPAVIPTMTKQKYVQGILSTETPFR